MIQRRIIKFVSFFLVFFFLLSVPFKEVTALTFRETAQAATNGFRASTGVVTSSIPVVGATGAPTIAADAAIMGSTAAGGNFAANLIKFPLVMLLLIGALIFYIILFILEVIANLIIPWLTFFFAISIKYSYGLLLVLGKISAITIAWTALRDLANIAFIFILLYIAIMTILQASKFNTQKFLANVILTALLVNFSFLFTQVIISVGNSLGFSIYEMAQQVAVDEEITLPLKDPEKKEGDVGKYIIKKMGHEDVTEQLKAYGGKTASQIAGKNNSSDAAMLEALWKAVYSDGFMGLLNALVIFLAAKTFAIILTFIVIIIFLLGGILLFVRVVSLIILLITSPIGFVGFVLPQTQKFAKEWWEGLTSQVFFFPIFMMTIWITMTVGKQASIIPSEILQEFQPLEKLFGNVGTDPILSSSLQFLMTLFPAIMKFSIMAGFLIAGLTISKRMSSKGGELVTSVSGKVMSDMSNFIFGTAGFLGRNTFGRGADLLRKSDQMQKLARRTGVFGTLALKGLDRTASSSFDARATRGFKGVASATGFGDKDIGVAGGKGGIKAQDEAYTKFWKEGANLYKDLDDTDPEVAKKKARKTKSEKALEDRREIVRDTKERIADEKVTLQKMKAKGSGFGVVAIQNQIDDISTLEKQLKLMEKKEKMISKIVEQQRKEYELSKSAPRREYGESLKGATWVGGLFGMGSASSRKAAGKSITDEFKKEVDAIKQSKEELRKLRNS
jgi:signal transduction histidine kinase